MLYALDGIAPTLPENGDYWIAPNAVLIGDVRLMPGASIWFNAVLRGDNEPIIIGANSNIQENCVLHTDMGFPLTIGAECTIGHQAILHGCELEDGVLIGMGATVLNGAQIKTGSLVGAGALVTEGKSFDPGSMILGSPAKTVKQLDTAAQNKLRHSAYKYVQNAQRFRNGLHKIALSE